MVSHARSSCRLIVAVSLLSSCLSPPSMTASAFPVLGYLVSQPDRHLNLQCRDTTLWSTRQKGGLNKRERRLPYLREASSPSAEKVTYGDMRANGDEFVPVSGAEAVEAAAERLAPLFSQVDDHTKRWVKFLMINGKHRSAVRPTARARSSF